MLRDSSSGIRNLMNATSLRTHTLLHSHGLGPALLRSVHARMPDQLCSVMADAVSHC